MAVSKGAYAIAALTLASLPLNGVTAANASAQNIPNEISRVGDKAPTPPGTYLVKLPFDDAIFNITDSPEVADETTGVMYVPHQQWVTEYGSKAPTIVTSIPGTVFEKQLGIPHIYANISSHRIHLTFSEWVSMGSPKPIVGAVDVVKYPWSTNIYTVSFFGPGRSQWLWHKLSFAEWIEMGRPTARNAGWIQGSQYSARKNAAAGGNDIYVALGGETHRLTFSQWVDAGRPLDPFQIMPTL